VGISGNGKPANHLAVQTTSSSSLHEQQIVVLGGSSGIGLAVAELALAAGARVTVIARDRARLALAAARLGNGVTTRSADFNDPAALEAALAHLAHIDHVYVAAGTAEFASALADPAAEKFKTIQDRVLGSMEAVKLIAGRMPPGGSFVFTGGVSTDRPVAGAWGTSVSTAAIEQLARTLAVDLAPLRFNAISPGWTDTPMWDPLLGADKAAVFASIAEKLPVRRLATPHEVAEAVLLLMRVRAITGEILHVDGGGRLV
jgi:NAD(P)-dependent dehydrogenase (short-subunit alcohol dehydrogenase family)